MKRREVLESVSLGASLSVAGCLSDGATADDTPSATDSALELVPASETPDAPKITQVVASWPVADVTISGTVTMENGCTTLTLGSKPKMVNGRVCEIDINTREKTKPCAQSRREMGYRLVVSYEEACPRVVRVLQPGDQPVELALNCL